MTARALWITATQTAELRDVPVSPAADDLIITTLFSGISRGTERLVFQGQVPADQHVAMRAPFQDGAFAFPVKYGYAAVGVIENTARQGQTVFALFPHQSQFAVPDHMAIAVPDNVPAGRAILAANMETALNILWDAHIGIGDRVTVIGAGVVGALVGYLAARIPGTDVTLVDIDPARAGLASTLCCQFAAPDAAPTDADIVVNTSASSAGLALAINSAGIEARIIEASWYGATETTVPLGGAFHQRRLQINSSQVGRIPAHKAARWTYERRLTKALALLADPALDALISGETPFAELADAYGNILSAPQTLCHRVRYET